MKSNYSLKVLNSLHQFIKIAVESKKCVTKLSLGDFIVCNLSLQFAFESVDTIDT
jgi:hypothetical protein